MNAIANEDRAVFTAFSEKAKVQVTPAKKVWIALGIVVFGALDVGVLYFTMHQGSTDAMGVVSISPWLIGAMAVLSLSVFFCVKIFLDKDKWGALRYIASGVLLLMLYGAVLFYVYQQKGGQVSDALAAGSGQSMDLMLEQQMGGAPEVAKDGTNTNTLMTWLVLAVEAAIRLVPGVICLMLTRSWSRLSKVEAEAKMASTALAKFDQADNVYSKWKALEGLKANLPAKAAYIKEASVIGAIDVFKMKIASDLQSTEAELNSPTILDGRSKQALEEKRIRLQTFLANAANLH